MFYFTINTKNLKRILICAVLLILLGSLFCIWAANQSKTKDPCSGCSDISCSDIEVSPKRSAALPTVGLSSAGTSTPRIPDDAVVPVYVNLNPLTVESDLARPLESARISSAFGFRVHPISGAYSFHSGLDLASAEGTDISAVLNGVVTTAKYADDYGNYIIIDHGDFQTLYAHCLTLCVSSGDNVLIGQKIAEVGSSGNATGSHLHFEVRRSGQRYDPATFLGKFYS